MRNSALMLAVIVLVACAEAPEEPVAAGSGTATLGGSVTYKYGDDIGDAAVKARTYCAKYRKRAWLRTTGRTDGENYATYDCR